MNDMIIKAAQDPSCILAVTPDRGGSWWAALRPGGNYPWPSPVPRNFAEEPETWYDFQNMQLAADWTHDYTFECTFMLHTRDNPAPVLYVTDGQSQMFGVYQYRDNTIGLFTTLCRSTASAGKYLAYIITAENATIFWESYHTIKIVVNGNSTSFYIDNELIRTFSSGYERTPKVDLNLAAPTTKTGYIGNCFIRDDTAGRIVWSYPSEAERVRLLTKTNVRTDRGVFEAADTSKRWSVTTQLRAASLLPECTIIVEADNPNGELATIISCAQRPNPAQGFFVIRAIDSTSVMFGYSGKNSSGITSYPTRFITCPDGKHVFAFVLDYSTLQLRIYIDGAEVDNRAMDTGLVAPPEFDETAKPVILGVSSTSDGLNLTSKISHCLIFDRALTAAEIAALMPKKQLLSWAGIQDVVRRGIATKYFSVGDVIEVKTPRWTIEYEVAGFDQIEPADGTLTHSMTLIPIKLSAMVQFDAAEPENPDVNRSQHGCNRWDWSAIRQWMNSASDPGEWWTAQHEYDASPSYAATRAGFMADLPTDFLSAVAPARVITALPDVDGGGFVETIDKFFLPSITEIFGVENNNIAEGKQMTKFVNSTDSDRIAHDQRGNIVNWWLRSPMTTNSIRNYFVNISGEMSFDNSGSAFCAAYACIIA